ncbi:hypothetical protein HRI_003009700 [Hibiscus trionum]|uniref:Uncharacterized protein n=1 Tax=Hibiscus trionum TaxID=183268 RepID=A0A9W7IAD1_HIBTR|nr:hypothetical protein HRI_003009700 [Hibiscus trionum]
MLFGRKLPIKLLQGQKPPQPQECRAGKNQKENMKGGKKESSCNFILIMELRKKIIAFRDIFDLPHLNTSVSMDQLVIRTMKDLRKFYPESIPNFRISELKRLPLDKVLVYFCKALQGLGDTTKMSDGWMDKCKYDIHEYDNGKCKNVEKVVEIAVETLNGLIKIAREKFDVTDEDDENKELKESYSDNGSSCPSPVTPTSVLPEMTNGSPKASSSDLLPLRVKAEGKLKAVDVKRLALDKLPMVQVHVPSSLNQKKATNEKQKKEVKGNPPVIKASIVDKTGDFSFKNAKLDVPPLASPSALASPPSASPLRSPSPPSVSPFRSTSPSPLPSPPASPLQPLSASSFPSPSPLPPASSAEVSLPRPPSEQAEMSTDMDTDIKLHPLPPPAPPLLLPNVVSGRPPAPPLLQPNVVSEGPPLPPPLTSQQTVEAARATLVATESKAAARIPLPLPRSPPPPTSSKTNVVATGAPLPAPPPVPLRSKVEPNGAPLPVPPPPPGTTSTMPQPPPPGAAKSLHPNKANTKLKRSSQMSNLYRVLRGKVEGCPVQSKSSSEKKRSAYFQQLEEDVEKYAKSITELKTAINTFSTNDMTKLLKFHKHVESILENLTDETQVLARFEGFPHKKLEALRTASALYSKLESMITVLQNWNFDLPLAELLDKVDYFFNKMKVEIDALEQTKHEEIKKFMSHNIEFDFQILVRIKEAMLGVSSNCMELAMKERREVKLIENEGSKTKAEAQKKGCIKMQWRAFQLAFRVYTFAGGHDNRTDMLSQEPADEIQTDPQLP